MDNKKRQEQLREQNKKWPKVLVTIKEDKYFTPDPEELRIGYLCEKAEVVKGEEGYELKWPEKLTPLTAAQVHGSYGDWIRVPYLTKEQIEAEGWKQEGDSPNGFYYIFTKTIGKYANEVIWKVIYYRTPNYIAPLAFSYFKPVEEGTYDSFERWSDKFTFTCKDINTFRYICKLIGI